MNRPQRSFWYGIGSFLTFLLAGAAVWIAWWFALSLGRPPVRRWLEFAIVALVSSGVGVWFGMAVVGASRAVKTLRVSSALPWQDAVVPILHALAGIAGASTLPLLIEVLREGDRDLPW